MITHIHKIPTKIISLLLIQVFLATSLSYPSDIKDISSLYTPARASLRMPLQNYKRQIPFQKAYALIQYMRGQHADNKAIESQISYYLREYCNKANHWEADLDTHAPLVKVFFAKQKIEDKNDQQDILIVAQVILQTPSSQRLASNTLVVTGSTNTDISRREMFVKAGKGAAAIAVLLAGGYIADRALGPSKKDKKLFASLSVQPPDIRIHEHRKLVARIMELQANRANMLEGSGTGIDRFFKGNKAVDRFKAIQFAADKFELEPEFLAGIVYSEWAYNNSIELLYRIMHGIVRILGYRGTFGLAATDPNYLLTRDFVNLLIEKFELEDRYDRFTNLEEFLDLYRARPEDRLSLISGYKDLLIGLASEDDINIFLAAFIIRKKLKEIKPKNIGYWSENKFIPRMDILEGHSREWLVTEFQEIPATAAIDFKKRYGDPFGATFYHPLLRYFIASRLYKAAQENYRKPLGATYAYVTFLKWGGFKRGSASGASSISEGQVLASNANFSLLSKNNRLNSQGDPVNSKFSIGDTEFSVEEMGRIIHETDELGRIENIPGLNTTFTIRGPTERRIVADFLLKNPQVLQEALSRSKSLHEGELAKNITIILADKYDYLAGDHRQNNLIILNASDLEAILKENPVFASEFITSLLSEKLVHERGADGNAETEERLALETAYKTKTGLKSMPKPRPLSEYIELIETVGVNAEREPGYINYLKALNRYEELDWTEKHASLVQERTVVVCHMEMGLSRALLENLYRKLISEKGYSEQAAELEVGETAKLTMAGGLGNIKRDLTETWAEKGADIVSMNILYGKWIKGVGFVGEDNIRHLLEILGAPVEQFDIEIFDRDDVWQRKNVNVSVYRDPFSPFPNYWIYCPEVFDGAYPEGKEHLAQQLVLYRKASLELLKRLKEKNQVKGKFLFTLSEVYTAFIVPDAVSDIYKDDPIFKDVYIHHYNHTVVAAGMPKLLASLYDFIGINRERYGSSIIEGDQIVLARIIGREADMITGCSMAHTDILRQDVMKDFKDKIPGNISEENSEGVYLGNWQGEEIQKVIAKYYVRLEANDDTDLLEKLDSSPDMREAFIDDLIEAVKKQKDKSIAWFNREDVNLDKDSALVTLVRRIVPYKRIDILVEMLKFPEYRKRFIELGISIIVGGRKFDRDEQDFGITQIRTLEKLVEKYPDLKNCVAIVLDDARHAGYNIFIATRIYPAVDSAMMLSDKGQEAGPTSPSKALVNGGAIIAVLDGVIHELLIPFNSDTREGNGFEVKYEDDGRPSVESLFKALEDFSAVYRNPLLRRSLAYNALKTGMVKANISTRQGPGLIELWQEGLERKQAGASLASNALTGREAVKEFIDTQRDAFIDFNEAQKLVKDLVSENKKFAVVLFDGDAIKDKNDAYGHEKVDQMILEMVKAFNEMVRLLGEGEDGISMKVFRRGGDEFSFIIETGGLKYGDIKIMLELSRISVPKLMSEKPEWQGDGLVLTGSIGAIAVDPLLSKGINERGRLLDLNTFMAGANYALGEAKKEIAGQRRMRGNRIHVLSADQNPEIDKWFHGTGGASIFKNNDKQGEIEGAFGDTKILKGDRDSQVPIVYSDPALRRIIQKESEENPDATRQGVLISIDAFWKHPEFIRRAEEANAMGVIHKGRSYIRDFFRFSMGNEVFENRMSDADWLIKFFGYVIDREVKKKFGEGFELQLARAPPGQSPDRFLIWLRPKYKRDVIDIGDLNIKLGELLTEITSSIKEGTLKEENVFLDASLQATVAQFQDNVGETFGACDRLSSLYVAYPVDGKIGMDNDVAKNFISSWLEPDDDTVIITEGGHRIVRYDTEKEDYISNFRGMVRQAASEKLTRLLPKENKENYIETLRRLYIQAGGDPAEIVDGMKFHNAARKIIEKIKVNRNNPVRLEELVDNSAVRQSP